MKKQFLTILLLTIASLAHLCGQEPWCPEPTNHLVNDYSQILTPAQVQEFEQRLIAFDDSTSNQILIIITPTLHDCEIMDLGTRIGTTWGVGQKGKHNGVVMLIKSKADANDYGDVAILPGYGLEGALPDVRCKRITEKMVPHLTQGDYYTAISTALDIIEPACTGEYHDQREHTDEGINGKVFIGVLALIIAAIVIGSHNSKNKHHDHNDFDDHNSSRRNLFLFPFFFPRGGGFGGGGFGGSGFGGGGFGGFGGGSFGGGGSHSRF